VAELHLQLGEDLANLSREATTRRDGAALHEDHHGGRVRQRLQPVLERMSNGRQRVKELALLLEFLHDVQPADQLSIGVQLGVRGPVGVRLQPLPHIGIR